MRERLAIHFAFAAFGLSWAWICLCHQGSLETFGGVLVFTALSALIGWLSFSPSGRGWTAWRVVGWTPLVAGVLGIFVGLIVEHDLARWTDALMVGCGFAAGSIVLYPLYLPVVLFTRRTA